ncbi:M28 family peptidase [Sediminicola luteus]|uniref:Vacuolar membrane protease n=1 Tax=Sediminicola luteus TaxID=319238 RepID=A0A2A4GEP1_9FLAO|nr:M28 family peptidase [Sediminicola luteus]PCE66212.1 peptidase M28 [Sediminicola luteus]
MKKSTSLLAVILIGILVFWSFSALLPSYSPKTDTPEAEFSTDRAMAHVKAMSTELHGVGFPGHAPVREYVVQQLEKMGLEVSLQEGYTSGDWANYSKAINVLARIKGSGNGKALLLMSHYDSGVHSSFGASDAASGVATVLEGIRAYLASGESPTNDIILLLTDAEELGLNGADLFVNHHPWAKDVGLAINFEARGSGGPGYMLIETNGGNSALIDAYAKADSDYPVANSLAYSIYKMLPNDTDLTVFREDGDIEGFNFAFIDDHFDYHTALDVADRLDPETLAHQGANLMPLLHHSALASLALKSDTDQAYFNVPIFKLVSYPFSWIYPMLGLAVLLFVVLLIFGFQKNMLQAKAVFTGFLPALIAIVLATLAGFIGWKALLWIYPDYNDMLHGFTYNGYSYIAAFVALALGICLLTYKRFKELGAANLLVGPIFIWLLVCTATALYLKGAAFFVIPVFGLLAALWVSMNQKQPSMWLLVLLAVPAIWIFAPFIKMFPVGLGLKMLMAATLFTALTFFFVLPLTSNFKNPGFWGRAGLLFFLGFMIKAHTNSGFAIDTPKPSSLLYVLDADTNSAQWASYDHRLIDWNKQFLGQSPEPPTALADNTISSKYSTGFNWVAQAPMKAIASPDVRTVTDTLIGGKRHLEICITPQRDVNRLEVYSNAVAIEKALINEIPLSEEFMSRRNPAGKLLTHYITDNETSNLSLVVEAGETLELTLYEASNDLLFNPLFSIPPRPETSIPLPFVLNDAVLVKKTVRL